ncbi:hypothetical protein NXW74_21610 [Bacteroides ovatus]|nr:hypothetical protein NXW74_21610 [Bacteroides ovatus]
MTNGISSSKRKHIGINIKNIIAYVVLTNDFPLPQSLSAIASVNLFFNPNVNPISKKPSQTITLDNVSQIPYNSLETYPNVIGTSINDTMILNPLIAKETIIFFFTTTLLSLPVTSLDFIFNILL